MEVTIISGIDPYVPKPGGTESYVMGLIPFLCEQGIKTTLIGVSSNKKERAFKYRNMCREVGKNFSFENTAKQTIKVYSEAINWSG